MDAFDVFMQSRFYCNLYNHIMSELFENEFVTLTLQNSALGKRCMTFRLTLKYHAILFNHLFSKSRSLLNKAFEVHCDNNLLRKGQAVAFIEMVDLVHDYKPNEDIRRMQSVISTKLENIFDFDTWFDYTCSKLEDCIDTFEEHGSGWKINKIEYVDFKIVQYKG